MGPGRDGVTTGSVVSADGTRIGYRCGPRAKRDLVARRRKRVAAHDEARTFACRRIHGVPARPTRSRDEWRVRPAYSIRREDEDLAALVEYTGATCVFGPADGGLFALHGAIGLGKVRRVAAYEPLLMLGGANDAAIRRMFTTMQQMLRADARQSCTQSTKAWIGRSAAGTCRAGWHSCARVPVPCRGWLN